MLAPLKVGDFVCHTYNRSINNDDQLRIVVLLLKSCLFVPVIKNRSPILCRYFYQVPVALLAISETCLYLPIKGSGSPMNRYTLRL